jgi:hypothetical protein
MIMFQGAYHLYNMSVNLKAIPRSFPFRKGRIFTNFTTDNGDIWAVAYVDMELKEANSNKFKAQ